PFSASLPNRYNTASMMPQARLHPSAPMSMVRTSARSASATLSEPVNVRTMISPKSTSEMRSLGSSARLCDLMRSSCMGWMSLVRFRNSLRLGRQQIKRHGEDQIHQHHQDPDEPR